MREPEGMEMGVICQRAQVAEREIVPNDRQYAVVPTGHRF